uniref:Aspartyl protease n=1 Tax=Candidatus Kentrum sp. TC TaxID=2126339 RepID=A0A450YYT4_9GAMM|nr:MAG: hypothetical protein BECKTC1821E_GA0114239_10687 [Candidatus Kentron sp. TC]
MGRIREMLDVDGRDSWTLFDTGARNTYIVPAVASVLTVRKARHPYRTALGGGVKVSERGSHPGGRAGRAPHTTHAMVLDNIGRDEEGKEIEVLFGALAMQQWGIGLLPAAEKLDLVHYPRGFVEW